MVLTFCTFRNCTLILNKNGFSTAIKLTCGCLFLGLAAQIEGVQNVLHRADMLVALQAAKLHHLQLIAIRLSSSQLIASRPP